MEQLEQAGQNTERASVRERLSNWAERMTNLTYTDLKRMSELYSDELRVGKVLELTSYILFNPLKWFSKIYANEIRLHEHIDELERGTESNVDDIARLIRTVEADTGSRGKIWKVKLLLKMSLVEILDLGLMTYGLHFAEKAGEVDSLEIIIPMSLLYSLSFLGGVLAPIGYFMEGDTVREGERGDRGTELPIAETPLSEEPSPAEEPVPVVREPAVEAVDTRRNLGRAFMAGVHRALRAGRGLFQGILPRRQRGAEGEHEELEAPLPEVRQDEEAALTEAPPVEGQQPGGEVASEAEASRGEEFRGIDTGLSVPLGDYIDGERNTSQLVNAEGDIFYNLLGASYMMEKEEVHSMVQYTREDESAFDRIVDMMNLIYDIKVQFISGRGNINLGGIMELFRFTIQDLVERGFGDEVLFYSNQFHEVLTRHHVALGEPIQEDQLQAVTTDMARIWLGDTLYEAGTHEENQAVWRSAPVEGEFTAGQAEFGVHISRYEDSDHNPAYLKQTERTCLEVWMGVGANESNTLRVLAHGDDTLNRQIDSVVDSVYRLKVDYMDDQRTPDLSRTRDYMIMFLQRLEDHINEGNMSGLFRALLPDNWRDGERLDETGIQQVADRLLHAWLGDRVHAACGGELDVEVRTAAQEIVERPEPPGLRARLREWRERLRGWVRGHRGRGGEAEVRVEVPDDSRVPLDAYRAAHVEAVDLIQRERGSFYALAGVEEEGRNAMRDVIEQDSFLNGILGDLSETVYLVKNDAAYTRYDEENWNTAATQTWIFLEGLLRVPRVTEAIFSENFTQILFRNGWETGRDLEKASLQAAGREVLHLWVGDEVWGILREQIGRTQHAAAAPAETAGGSVEGFGVRIEEYEELVNCRRRLAILQESVKDIDLASLLDGHNLEFTNELADLQERERDLLSNLRQNERGLLFKFLGLRAGEMYSGTTADGDFHGDINTLIRLFVEMKRALYTEDGTWFENYRELFNTLDTMVCRLLMNVQARGYRLGSAFTEELNRHGVNIEDPSSMPDELNRALRGIIELWLGTNLHHQLQQYI